MSQIPQTQNVLYVDSRNTRGVVPDGSWRNPFQTEQDAFDYIESLLDASVTNQYTIHVIYPSDQPIIARCPFTHLVFGGMVSALKKSAGLPILVTNATLASVATFLANDGDTLANADTQYTDLIPDPALAWPNGVTTPVGSSIEGVTVAREDADNTKCGVMAIIAGPGADPTLAPRYFNSVAVLECMYLRNALQFECSDLRVKRSMQVRQVAVNTMFNVDVSIEFSNDFSLSEDRSIAPYDLQGYTRAQAGAFGTFVGLGASKTHLASMPLYGNLDCRETAIVVGRDVTAEDLIIDGSPNVDLLTCGIRDGLTLTNPGTPTVLLRGVHLGGDINLAAGGTKTVTMNGGAYMGSLTDPDTVFARSAGN